MPVSPSRIHAQANQLHPSLSHAQMQPMPNGLSAAHLAPAARYDDAQFFDRVKRALDNRETYNEFLKLVNLFTQDIIDTARLVREAKPIYWLTGSIHSPETGSPEMLMELLYRLAVEESPNVRRIRDGVITLITPVTETDGRDRAVDAYALERRLKVGRGGVREGIVHDRRRRQDAVAGVLWAAHDLGLRTAGLIPSPLRGGSGNHEYLVRFSAAVGSDPSEWSSAVSGLP